MSRRLVLVAIGCTLALSCAACTGKPAVPSPNPPVSREWVAPSSATTQAVGAPGPGEACRRCAVAIAVGDTARFEEVTGSTLSTTQVSSLRRSLFGTAAPVAPVDVYLLSNTRRLSNVELYDPVVEMPSGKLVGLAFGVRGIGDGKWAVVSIAPRSLTASDVVATKQEAKRRQLMDMQVAKPVIYLYPRSRTRVDVRLDIDAGVTKSEPRYDEDLHGWSVVASPSGSLSLDGRTYPYLFWESHAAMPVGRDGFVVSAQDADSFLRAKLALLGLSPHESDEFMDYWLPRMQEHRYSFVRFAGPEYERVARLSVTPRPDTVIRVFMELKELDAPIAVPEQKLSAAPERRGFVVVEWGGGEMEPTP